MAQKVLVQIFDDLDGSTANQTVHFSLDGIDYEIDLSQDNADELRDSLAHFVSASRRVGGRKLRQANAGASAPATTSPDRERNSVIRAWAAAEGYELADRGRVPDRIVEAYEKAVTQPAKK